MSESPPSSQQMQRKAQAKCGTKQQKKELRQVCGHCCSGPGAGRDLHPGGVWIKCGEKGCRSSNFNFHAKCHGISIVKEQAKFFCEKFIRCPAHVNQGQLNLAHLAQDLASSDEDVTDSDEDFQPNKQLKKRKKKQEMLTQKRKAKVFPTPGSYKLQKSVTDSSDDDTGPSRENNSVEKSDTEEVLKTNENFVNDNVATSQDNASKIKSGQAKEGLVDGDEIMRNVLPVNKARTAKYDGETIATAPKPSGSLKVKNKLKTVKKSTAPTSTVKRGEQIEKPELKKVLISNVNKPILLPSYLKGLDSIYF